MADTSDRRPAGPTTFHDVAALFSQAFGIFRARTAAIVAVASAVELGPTVVASLIEEWAEHHRDSPPDHLALALAVGAAVAVAVLGTLGSTFLAGLLDRLAGHHVHGHPFQGLGHTLRTLPYGRLILADLLVAVVVLVGGALLVVPGLVAYTLLAPVGPVIIIEDRGVFDAVRRAVGLVRPHFVLVFLAVTSVTVGEVAVEELLEHFGVTEDLPGELVASFLVGVLAGTVVGLIKVCTTYELLARENQGFLGSE